MILGGLASLGGKAVTIAVMLITVPLAVSALGSERYGLWMAVTSLVTMFGFADLGVGNGLVTSLAAASGRDDRDSAARLVSSAFAVSLVIALILAAAFAVAHAWVDWAAFFNVSAPKARAETGPAVAILFACFVAGLPLGMVLKVLSGLQEAYLASLWLALGSLLGLGGVVAAVRLELPLEAFVAASAGAPVVALGVAFAVEFFIRRPHLRPRLLLVDRSVIRSLMGTGLLFLALQIAVTVTNSADNVIAARMLGADAVTELSIATRIFSVSPLLMGMFLGPLWPAYGEAMGRGDSDWIRATLKRSLVLAGSVGLVIAVAALLLGRWIVSIWVGPEVAPGGLLLGGLAAWTFLGSVGGPVAMYLNGLQVLRVQAVTSVLMATVALGAKVWMTERLGVAGLPWASVIAQVVFVTVPNVFVVRITLREMARRATTAIPAAGESA